MRWFTSVFIVFGRAGRGRRPAVLSENQCIVFQEQDRCRATNTMDVALTWTFGGDDDFRVVEEMRLLDWSEVCRFVL